MPWGHRPCSPISASNQRQTPSFVSSRSNQTSDWKSSRKLSRSRPRAVQSSGAHLTGFMSASASSPFYVILLSLHWARGATGHVFGGTGVRLSLAHLVVGATQLPGRPADGPRLQSVIFGNKRRREKGVCLDVRGRRRRRRPRCGGRIGRGFQELSS